MKKIERKKKTGLIVLAFAGAFLLGRAAAYWGGESISTFFVKQEQAENWGLGFGEDGTQPTGTVTADELKKYDAYYLGDEKEKVLYLTFDCGYENGNTEAILDALKKHNAKATFFCVGNFLETSPELIKRMEAEGHTVGNHTYHHPDMSSIADEADDSIWSFLLR